MSPAPLSRLAAFPPFALLALGAASAASAQCATCPQPAVVASPVAQTTYSPVVLQTQPRSDWYPGKLIGEWLFGRRQETVAVGAPVVATTAYRPVFSPSQSVGVAPATVTAAYAPQTTTVGYAPTATTAVTLSPVSPCCDPCASASSFGATTAGYDVSGSSPCVGCAGEAPASYDSYGTTAPAQSYGEPTPALQPEADVPPQRTLRPESDEQGDAPAEPRAPNTFQDDSADTLRFDNDSSNAYFEAPQLFNPQDRTTQRPTAPVWTAVYRDATPDRHVTATSASTRRPTGRHVQQGASGWRSARD